MTVRFKSAFNLSFSKFYRQLLTFFLFTAVISSSSLGEEVMTFSHLQLNGSATLVSVPNTIILRLTEAQANQTGSAFSQSKVDIRHFSTFFTFRITESKYQGGDGLVFVLQSEGSKVLGEKGNGLGYGRIASSVGIEFDTWNNTAWRNDFDHNHLGINVQGEFQGPIVSITPSFKNGTLWHVWIDYNGDELAVRISESSDRPSKPQLSYSLNLQDILGDTEAFVGFTAATGGAYAKHEIISWNALAPKTIVTREEYEALKQQYIDCQKKLMEKQ
jgi:hypothetical protein